MSITLLIGSQWGDEGKGKLSDFLAQKSDYIIRYHGGNNAGHTVINKYGKFPLHLVPSGIFSKKSICCISNGTVLDLEVLISEIEMLSSAKINLKGKLLISPRCHLIMPYHRVLEGLYENAKQKSKIGSTGRGIGPVYADKVSYNGIRIFDLENEETFKQKLKIQLLLKNKIIKSLGGKEISEKETFEKFNIFYKKIKPFIKEPFPILQKAIKNKKTLLFEGAQGMFLDNDWGTYPFVTASNVVAGNINAGAGIPGNLITDVIGAVKAYTTRVGEGPFPTELFDNDGKKLQGIGAEFGATTGRARRCGWFDAELIKFAASINGFTGIALTKLDVLDSFKKIKICIGYKYKNKKVNYWDLPAEELKFIKPIYKTIKGWQKETKGIKNFNLLPNLAKSYISEIEKQIGVKVKYISTGPERNEIIVR